MSQSLSRAPGGVTSSSTRARPVTLLTSGDHVIHAVLAEVIRKNTSIPASDLIDVINNAVSEWSGGAPAADDVTLVSARRLVAA